MAIVVNMKFRTEFDSLGKIKVPADKYWGASTQRSNKYFDIGDFLVRPIVIKSIAMIKKAAAIVNAKNGDLDKKISKIIVKVANEVISGKLEGVSDRWLSPKRRSNIESKPTVIPSALSKSEGVIDE